MIGIYQSAPPLWWTETTFGAIVLCMFFLTWSLIILNLTLWTALLIRRILRGDDRKSSKK